MSRHLKQLPKFIVQSPFCQGYWLMCRNASSLKSPQHGLWEPTDLDGLLFVLPDNGFTPFAKLGASSPVLGRATIGLKFFQKTEPDTPEFKELHIRMKGYDYPTLESYAKYVHRAVQVIFDLQCDAWASQAKSLQVRTFHPYSTSVNQKYDLHLYDRTVCAENVPTTTVPILLQFIQKNCPQGVEVAVKEPDPEEEQFRYVPDYDVLELQAQKEAIESGKVKKK